ncbi:membrane-associated tyrosine- and threonine-specific cdc2-inhibitory kinase [Ambystoma mexicanum]|uniref:membrane-associated tyrosine- and threonine-specific cdc2-inhibitory kinase n=1 Tax=Ambystoma mexicanum TaxID=8296 RepID=UPI0037E7AB67
MPVPKDSLVDSQLSRTPIPIPAFFKEAEQGFSLKKRGRSLCFTMPPRPPAKSPLPISRFFPNKHQSWSQPRPQSVSFRSPDKKPLCSRLYDEGKQELFFDQCFQRICKLGRGSFGEVYKVKSREDGQLYAVKRSLQHFRGELDRQRKLEEVQKHERVGKHPNCVQFVRAWEEKRHLYIQTELCNTNLQHYCEERGPLRERKVMAFFCDLLRGLKHLHDRNLVHMDIKPANIFICMQETCKLGDFGLMLELDKGNLSEAQEGDPRYMAPELLNGEYTKAADVFSLGMTILEIACNMDLPKGGEGWQQLRHGYLPSEFTADLSPELLSILTGMLEPDHRKRMTVNSLLATPIMRKVEAWRRVMLAAKSGISKVFSVCQLLLAFFYIVWQCIRKPLRWMLGRGKIPSQPSSPVPTPPGDCSISSDLEEDSLVEDVFEFPGKSTNLLRYNLTCPGDLDCHNFTNNNNDLHSPDIDPRPSIGSTSTPRNISPEFAIGSRRRSTLRSSPNMSRISQESPCSQSSSSPSARSLSRLFNADLQEHGQHSSFEPRNLLSMFEDHAVDKD